MDYFGLNGIERKTKAELIAMLRKESAWSDEMLSGAQRRIDDLVKRRNELQATNNRYLERARTADAIAIREREQAHDLANEATMLGERLYNAEAERDEYAKQLEAANDTIADLRIEIESDVNAYQVELTWLRMELAKAKSDLEFWVGEATNWAGKFAGYRQYAEKELRGYTSTKERMRSLFLAGLMLGGMGGMVAAVMWL